MTTCLNPQELLSQAIWEQNRIMDLIKADVESGADASSATAVTVIAELSATIASIKVLSDLVGTLIDQGKHEHH
jgi:hypothetical protein